MATRSVIRSGIGGLLFGGVLYLAGDTASDLITYSKLHSQAMELVRQDGEISILIGEPYTSGAWYDATLAFSHRDKVAHCTFQLKGSRGVTDIAVKAGRKPGYRSNALYNLIGPGVWQLVSCQAMVPSEGGLVKARSLMPEHKQQQQQQQQQQQEAGQAFDIASCQPCQVTQQPGAVNTQQPQQEQGYHKQQQDNSAAAAAAAATSAGAAGTQGSSWWRKAWWHRQKKQPQQQETLQN